MRSQHLIGLALVAWLAQAPAHAILVTDAALIGSPRSVITFDGYDGLVTTGPVNVGAEVGDTVTFTSTPFTELGAIERDLGNNGLWGVGERFVASDFIGPRGTLTFSFDTGVSSVGAVFNQFQSTRANSLTLVAYDIDGLALESYSYSIDTDAYGYNEGQFLGIARTSADIYSFGIADGSFVMDNLMYSSAVAAPVPEPTTWAMLLGGLGALVWRRRSSQTGPTNG